MNPVVIVFILAGALSLATAVPLMRKKVKMNAWYGIRIPAAFESEERWYEINRYGGGILLAWANAIIVVALIGAGMPRRLWVLYDWAALVVSVGTLAAAMGLIYRFARKSGRK